MKLEDLFHQSRDRAIQMDNENLDDWMDEVRGYRRTTANVLRMPARLNPADFARRIMEVTDRSPDVGLNSLQPMSPVVAMLGGRTWAVTGRMPDNAQIALYEDGRDYCDAHTDDATLLGPEVFILTCPSAGCQAAFMTRRVIRL